MTEEVLLLAKKIWNYHLLRHTLVKSDVILVLGSHDTRVAERAAELYRQGVPKEVVLIEDASTNTGENVVFSRRLLTCPAWV